MIKELEINNIIIEYCNEIKNLIYDLSRNGWHKKFICDTCDINYTNNKFTKRSDEFIAYDNFTNLIKEVNDIMLNLDFTSNINYTNFDDINVEFHYANTNDIEYPWSDIHCDDDNGILVNTIIFYLDIECENGEIVFYDINKKIIKKYHQKVKIKILQKLSFLAVIYYIIHYQ